MARFYVNETLSDKVTFPITEVGKSTRVTMIIENTYEEPIELIPNIDDPDVKVLDYPKRLRAKETGTATWEFTPKKDRVTSLKSDYAFYEIIGPR